MIFYKAGVTMRKTKNRDKIKIDVTSMGNRIKKLRLEKQWSQLELAEKINLDNRQISNYEHGKTFPAVDTLLSLAKIFDVTVDYLLIGQLTNEAERRLSDTEMLVLFDKVDTLGEDEKTVIKKVINAFIVKSRIDDIHK